MKATNRDIKPLKSQRKLKERKKSMEFTKRTNELPKKRPPSKQSNRDVIVKLNSLKEMNDSELIRSEISDRDMGSIKTPFMSAHINHTLTVNPTLKTSASNANLR
jgi:hypothetical protein